MKDQIVDPKGETMTGKLNISMNQTTRSKGRVVWNVLFLILVIALTLVTFRIFSTIDRTSAFKPEDTQLSIRVLKRPESIKLMNEHIGNSQILPGAPWTISNIVDWSNNEFILHIESNGLMSVTLDNTITNEQKLVIENYGYKTIEYGNKTLISKTNKYKTGPVRIPLKLVNPVYNGELIFEDSSIKPQLINIKSKGITIKTESSEKKRAPWVSFPSNSEIIAQIWLEPGEISNYSFDSVLNSNELLNLIEENPAYLTLAREDQSLYYSIQINNSELELEHLAEIAKEVINRKNLSTTAWTLEDETVVQEIISDPKSIQSNFSSTENTSLITITNTNGDILRISKTSENIIISNFEPSLENNNQSKFSNCTNGNEFIHPSILNQSLKQNEIILNFGTIVFNTSKTTFCW